MKPRQGSIGSGQQTKVKSVKGWIDRDQEEYWGSVEVRFVGAEERGAMAWSRLCRLSVSLAKDTWRPKTSLR